MPRLSKVIVKTSDGNTHSYISTKFPRPWLVSECLQSAMSWHPDYDTVIIEITNPNKWKKPTKSANKSAPREPAGVHGYGKRQTPYILTDAE